MNPGPMPDLAPMQALSNWPASERAQLLGVFTDIDDTLTTHGQITADALQALADLRAAGLTVVAITGRPIGWCQPFVQGSPASQQPPWPVDAMVAENGAVAWIPAPLAAGAATFHKVYQQDSATRASNRIRMAAVAQRVQREVPAAQVTRDSPGRETDLAFDAAEFASLSPEQIAQVLDILHAEGMQTTVSSIHIHGCFGQFSKWQGAQWITQQLLGRKLEAELQRWAFVGDSGNDVAMFQHFCHSIGVANIRSVAASLSHLPRYITTAERGAGFAEVVGVILGAGVRPMPMPMPICQPHKIYRP